MSTFNLCWVFYFEEDLFGVQDMESVESKNMSEQPARHTKPQPQHRTRRRQPPDRALARRVRPQHTPLSRKSAPRGEGDALG